MTLTSSNPNEAQTLEQAFKLKKEGDTITLTRRNKPTVDSPDAFEVSYIAPPVIRKPKRIPREDK